jgi:PH (Pleckstrin Homology) domain-containing protein/putative oligomerization/nucleic acid binding protein
MSEHPQTGRIEQLAATKLNMKLGVRKELKKLTDKLAEDEEVVNLARGQYDNKTGLVVVTDRRILFTEQGMVRSRLEDFPYSRVSSVQTESGMMFGKLTIYSSGNKAVIDHIGPKERATEIGDYVRGHIGAGASTPQPQPSPAAESQPDVMQQLQQLGALRDSGVLTDAEFEAKKAELLQRL